MRRLLDRLYLFAAALAGLCLVLMTLLILAQVVGRWFDVLVPSTEDFSGFLLAAASFLALPHALREGAHIRVTLVISRLAAGKRRVVEILVLLLALPLMSYIAWSLGFMVYESWQYAELTQGYVPVPLWLPQLPVALGAALMVIALLDELQMLLRQGQTRYQQVEVAHVEEDIA
jgi:TRAP-type C4-dicarboxylate transport system permease small subunit